MYNIKGKRTKNGPPRKGVREGWKPDGRKRRDATMAASRMACSRATRPYARSASRGTMSKATMLNTLIMEFNAGPAVSL